MELDVTCGLKLKYGYIIIPESNQYTLYKRVKSRERGTGELRFDEDGNQIYTWSRIGFFSKTIHALKKYREELIKNQLTKKIMELDEYIATIKKSDEIFNEMLDKYGIKDV